MNKSKQINSLNDGKLKLVNKEEQMKKISIQIINNRLGCAISEYVMYKNKKLKVINPVVAGMSPDWYANKAAYKMLTNLPNLASYHKKNIKKKQLIRLSKKPMQESSEFNI